jgi:hypothetical protein
MLNWKKALVFCFLKMKRIAYLLTAVALLGCHASEKRSDKDLDGPKSAVDSMKRFSGDFEEKNVEDFGQKKFGSESQLWALASCDCRPTLLQGYFESIAGSRGVLPQILMPSVREEIKNSETLATLAKLPLGGVLAGIFTTDAKLAARIADGLGEKLTSSPGGSELGDRLQLRFDGFQAIAGQENSFRFSDQIARWQSVFAANGMWEQRAPIDNKDHGLQSLELLRTLAEWSYLVGIDKNSNGGFYGGLTVSEKVGELKINGPVDPRSKTQPAWFLSGTYSIDYGNESAKDTAISVREEWSRTKNDPITLDEQSRFWHTAAIAFKRLRPENREKIQSLFKSGASDKDGVLPADAHELPLAFLTSLKSLLPGPFIEKDSRLVRAQAALSAESSDEEADVLALARLTRALVAWIVELESVTKDTVSANTLSKVENAANELLPPLQVAIQTILQRHALPAVDVGGAFGIAIVRNGKGLELSEAAEVLLALVEAESMVLSSEFLQSRLVAMLDWFGGDLLGEKTTLSGEELLWLRGLSSKVSQRIELDAAWAATALKFVDRRLDVAP